MAFTPCTTTPVVTSCQWICNGNFECPVITTGTQQLVTIPNVPCWHIGSDIGTETISICNGIPPLAPPFGLSQFIELAASTSGQIWQSFNVPVVGSSVNISFYHAGKSGCPNVVGTNTMRILIKDGIGLGGTTLYTSATFTGGINTWLQHSITFLCPSLSPNHNYTVVFESIGAATCGNYLDDVHVNYTIINRVKPDIHACDSAVMTGDPVVAGTGLWTLVSGSGTIVTPFSPTTLITGLGIGLNVFNWAITEPYCGNGVIVGQFVYGSAPTTPILGNNGPLLPGATLFLTCATISGATQYSWSGPNGFTSLLQNPTIPSINLINAGIYTCTVTEPNGCIGIATTDVFVIAVPTYIVHDCDGVQPDFIASNDLSLYVGKTIQTCINTTPLTQRLRSLTSSTSCITLQACCDTSYHLSVSLPPSLILTALQTGSSVTFASYPGICFSLNSASVIPCNTPIAVDWSDNTTFTIFSDCSLCISTQVNNGFPPCLLPSNLFLLTNCCDINDQYVAITNSTFSQYEGFTIQIPSILGNRKCWQVQKLPDPTSGDIPSIGINAPNPLSDPSFITVVTCPPDSNSPCLCYDTWPDGCYCVTIEECPVPSDCVPANYWPGTFYTVFDSCELCQCKSYILHDCSNTVNDLTISNDFAIYIGKVVKITDCGDTCWEVSGPFNCTGNEVCVNPVEEVFDTCLLCSPVIPIPPQSLPMRRVKPGYYTAGCDPAYTEKISCNFAEAMYSQMIRLRYGLTMCCEKDLDKWDIKKQELDLRAIYDPDACKTIS